MAPTEDESADDSANDSAASDRSQAAIPDEPDLSAPLFFLSHANVHTTGTTTTIRSFSPDEAFTDFFNDLSINVNHLHFRRSGADPGFMDLTMRSGRDWEREILRAVGECQVFLALLSNPYSNSEFCGKEWHAFTKRRCWDRRRKAWTEVNECVIPVIWAAPLHSARVPAVVNAVERFTPAPATDPLASMVYQNQGVFGLKKTSHDAYISTIWSLAQEIEHKLQNYWVEPAVPTSYAELTDVFRARET